MSEIDKKYADSVNFYQNMQNICIHIQNKEKQVH